MLWEKVSEPHELRTGFAVVTASPSAKGMAIEAMNSENTSDSLGFRD